MGSINLQDHCEGVRATLEALYKQSMSATHPVVQGTLREGFVRQVLEGFLGRSISWSSGQIVGAAPANSVSGQMDLLLHSDLLPQVYMFDGALCLVPAGALVGAVEVKSNLTTGKKGTAVLDQAMDSLCDALEVCRGAGPTSSQAFVVAAFHSGQKRSKIITKIEEYLTRATRPADDFWPDAVVVLSGGKAHPKGFGIFRERPHNTVTEQVNVVGLTAPLWLVEDGSQGLAGLVSLFSKRRLQRATAASTFDFGSYIFRAAPAVAPPPAVAAASKKTGKKAASKKKVGAKKKP